MVIADDWESAEYISMNNSISYVSWKSILTSLNMEDTSEHVSNFLHELVTKQPTYLPTLIYAIPA